MTKANKRNVFSKRMVCIIMILAMMLNFAAQYALPVLSVNKDPYITLNGEKIEKLQLSDGEKVTIGAELEGEYILRYGWQIRYSASPERWINISMANRETLSVSCAMIASLADEDGKAYVRCVLYGDKPYYTAPLEISMTGVPYVIGTVSGQEDNAAEEVSVAESEAIIVDNVSAVGNATASSGSANAPVSGTTVGTDGEEDSTIAPESSSEADEGTATVPESSSEADEGIATAPESSSEANEGIATAPESSSEANEGIATAPESSSEANEGTATAPESSSEANEGIATAPESSSEANEGTATVPESSSEADESTATAPESSSEADEGIATAPESSSEADESTATTPENSENPAEGATAPVSGENASNGDSTEDTTEKFNTHSIVINYLFDDNTIAFEPYGASVAHNSSFYETVPSHYVVGYLPYRRVGEDYIEAPNVEFNIEHVTEDITINIIYEPTLVNFTVYHYLQNLHNDEYTLAVDRIQTAKALTGSIVPTNLALTEIQLPGFKSLSYERLEVAADGSTIVEIRYDRNYYLVDFDMNGGYGTEPVYTRYGDSVGANVPIRHGYVFNGWELVSYNGYSPTGSQQAEFALSEGTTVTVPAANLKYKAHWRTTQTTYTMVFWKENADDDGYTYWGHLEGLGALSGTFVDGRDIVSQVAEIEDEQYFTFNAGKTDKNILVEGDGSTIVNVYYTRNYYKLTIKATGICTIPVNHTHEEKCYDYVCGLSHVHSADCIPELICSEYEHPEHTDDCLICTVPEHTHSADCTCMLREHTHTKSCWTGVGNSQNSTPSGAPSTAEDGYIFRRTTFSTKYIFIKGTWYRYTGRASAGTVADCTCGYDTEHTHDEGCLCSTPEHSHGLSCYRDVVHVHGEACYSYSCGEIQHVHEDSCKRLKCGITENHTHSTTCNSSSSVSVVKEIYRKYGQSVKDIWPIVDDNGVIYNQGERWAPSDSSYYDQVLVYFSKMTPDSFTLTLDKQSYTPYTMQYYLEMLPDEEAPEGATVVTLDGKNYLLDNVIKARYNYVTKAEDFFDIVGFDQYKSSPSFSNNQISISGSESNKIVKFYYNRKTDHYLKFSSNGEMLDDKQQYGIMFGYPLESYDFVPDYPSKLEPNAYSFVGWYTSPGCYDGTEVDWSTLTMTEGDLLLYAKWAPVKHTVNVWLDYRLNEKVCEEQTVDHGAFAVAPHGSVTNGNYVFQGWFYMDEVNGERVEKAFNFSGMPVKEDMDIYAKWGSHVSVDYKVNYVLKETGEPIADPTVGSAIAGNNKTFEAKAGEDLYEGYKVGYYPEVNSHTITMSVEGDHEFTFYYVYVPSMPYAVRYVNAETGKSILPDKIVDDNSLSIVTETFKKYDKMMPDAYQKRLVLSASNNDSDGDGIFDDNVITFYYSYDEVHAYYKVVHYIQNIHADGYREYRSVETVGTIGESYTIEALDIIGFRFNGSLTTIDGIIVPTDENDVSGTLGDDGMLIEIYYDRVSYKYSVIYKDGVSGDHILPQKEGIALFGEQVTENAVDLKSKGYTLSSDSVKILNVSANVTHNIIEFVYIESIVSIKYYTVGYNDSGVLSRSSENVSAVSGVPLGSTPIVPDGYIFVGWFVDADCTAEADPSIVDQETMKLVPTKESNAIWGDNVEFFAKFMPKETKLTVMKSGWYEKDADQAFLFRLKGIADTDTADIDITFSIKGDGTAVIAGLPLGEYTVTELIDWAWRYESSETEKRITLDVDAENNVVTFTNNRVSEGWLDGNSSNRNIFS